MMDATEAKKCPFCGSEAELVPGELRRTLEEALTAEPNAKCSRPTCLARYITTSLAEWNERDTAAIHAAESAVRERCAKACEEQAEREEAGAKRWRESDSRYADEYVDACEDASSLCRSLADAIRALDLDA